MPLGGAAIPLALAAITASVVACAFRELAAASTPARVVAVVTLALIAVLCAGTIGDLALR